MGAKDGATVVFVGSLKSSVLSEFIVVLPLFDCLDGSRGISKRVGKAGVEVGCLCHLPCFVSELFL